MRKGLSVTPAIGATNKALGKTMEPMRMRRVDKGRRVEEKAARTLLKNEAEV
jgi:hypothetical protein